MRSVARTLRGVCSAESRSGSSPEGVSPWDALASARPLPAPDELAIEGLTETEWLAFHEVLRDV